MKKWQTYLISQTSTVITVIMTCFWPGPNGFRPVLFAVPQTALQYIKWKYIKEKYICLGALVMRLLFSKFICPVYAGLLTGAVGDLLGLRFMVN